VYICRKYTYYIMYIYEQSDLRAYIMCVCVMYDNIYIQRLTAADTRVAIYYHGDVHNSAVYTCVCVYVCVCGGNTYRSTSAARARLNLSAYIARYTTSIPLQSSRFLHFTPFCRIGILTYYTYMI